MWYLFYLFTIRNKKVNIIIVPSKWSSIVYMIKIHENHEFNEGSWTWPQKSKNLSQSLLIFSYIYIYIHIYIYICIYIPVLLIWLFRACRFSVYIFNRENKVKLYCTVYWIWYGANRKHINNARDSEEMLMHLINTFNFWLIDNICWICFYVLNGKNKYVCYDYALSDGRIYTIAHKHKHNLLPLGINIHWSYILK